MNPSITPRGVERGRGGGRRTAKDRHRDYDHDRKAPPSTVSEAITKRPKYEETTDDDDNLFLPTVNESATSTNRKSKSLTLSSPSERQRKSNK
jgi:hypothetical protein